MSTFTELERAQIKHFLAYPSWINTVSSILLGSPADIQPAYLVDAAFDRIKAEARDIVRRDLCACLTIESQLIDSNSRLKAIQIGNIKTNQSEQQQLREELHQWISTLANDLGVLPNPYANGATNTSRFNARVTT